MKQVAPLCYDVIFKKAFSVPEIFTAFVHDFLNIDLEIDTVEKDKTTHPALGSKVYEADVSALPLTDNGIHHLFVNGELMTIARYPNVDSPADKNWLKVGAGAGTDAFTDPALAAYGKPDGYWKGAT